MPLTPPALWIVATPIGNPADLSPRAREIISEADLLLAEDTRRASWLFRQLGIRVKKLKSFHDHNEKESIPEILAELEAGKTVALISDAGTPLLADPGYRLAQSCRRNGFPVRPVPGPSAPVAALSVAGLPPIPFTFLGFLPRDDAGKTKLFRAFKNSPGSLVFFERKDRLKDSLALALKILGAREAAICRELTKEHEEIISGALQELIGKSEHLLGEITVLIGPAPEGARLDEGQVVEFLKKELRRGLKLRQAVSRAMPNCPGWSSSELYELAINLRQTPRQSETENPESEI